MGRMNAAHNQQQQQQQQRRPRHQQQQRRQRPIAMQQQPNANANNFVASIPADLLTSTINDLKSVMQSNDPSAVTNAINAAFVKLGANDPDSKKRVLEQLVAKCQTVNEQQQQQQNNNVDNDDEERRRRRRKKKKRRRDKSDKSKRSKSKKRKKEKRSSKDRKRKHRKKRSRESERSEQSDEVNADFPDPDKSNSSLPQLEQETVPDFETSPPAKKMKVTASN